jgi:hypothetical protein
MSLENFAHINDISQELRDKLEQKVRSFGKTVRYKFDIAKPNPDPSKYNGDVIFPNMYTLDPTRFTIQDPYENRAGKSKAKLVALVDDTSINDKGVPERYKKVRVMGRSRSILSLNVQDNQDDFYMAMFLEMHPKLKGGEFADKNAHQVVSRIDENAAARNARTERSERLKALNIAQAFSDSELIDFADAMQWDSSEDIEVLRNKVEELADTNPIYFNDFVASKAVEYQSLIRQAINKSLIQFITGEYKYVWAGNQQTITVLSPAGNKKPIEKLSEWLQTSGDKGEDVYKRLKSLVKGVGEDEKTEEKKKKKKEIEPTAE